MSGVDEGDEEPSGRRGQDVTDLHTRTLKLVVFAGLISMATTFLFTSLEGSTIEAVLDSNLFYPWLLIQLIAPIAIYLDIKNIRNMSDWEPKLIYWLPLTLIPLFKTGVVFAYLARRYEKIHLQISWGWWSYVAITGGLLLILSLGLDKFGPFLRIFFWALIPAAIKYDMDYVTRNDLGWSPLKWFWIVTCIFNPWVFPMIYWFRKARKTRTGS